MLIGLGNGAMDVAMNALGVQVERARRRPIMSFFHAFFSVGNFIGAGAVLLLAKLLGITGGEHRHAADDHPGRGRRRSCWSC